MTLGGLSRVPPASSRGIDSYAMFIPTYTQALIIGWNVRSCTCVEITDSHTGRGSPWVGIPSVAPRGKHLASVQILSATGSSLLWDAAPTAHQTCEDGSLTSRLSVCSSW